MANGDITKVIEYDQIQVAGSWTINVRKATKVMEENSDGLLTELSRGFHRHVLQPFISSVDADGDWTHAATDISGEHASVKLYLMLHGLTQLRTHTKQCVKHKANNLTPTKGDHNG